MFWLEDEIWLLLHRFLGVYAGDGIHQNNRKNNNHHNARTHYLVLHRASFFNRRMDFGRKLDAIEDTSIRDNAPLLSDN